MPINSKRSILLTTSMWIVLSMLLVLSNTSIAQTSTIKGRVIDASTSEPIAFAGVLPDNEKINATLTNIDGYFALKASRKISTIKVVCVGYKSEEFTIIDINNINISLKKDTLIIDEVTIYPTANPAHRIINKAVENKQQNNPDNLAAYSCRLYNKAIIDLEAYDVLKADTAKYNKITRLRDTMYLIVNESVSERYYKYPDKLKETITAVKLSGFNNPTLTIQSTNFQPFHVYSDYISLMEENFLNPISKGSTQRYYFEIKDTLYSETDTIFMISFKPRKNSNIEGLEGIVGINTNNYAIQIFKAKPAGETLWKINIEQQYQFIAGHWFPKELNYDLKIPFGAVEDQYNGKCYIDNVSFDAEKINKVDFDGVALSFADTASTASNSYWQQMRRDSLNKKEQTTYRSMGRLNKKLNLDGKMELMNSLVDLKVPYKIFDFDLTQFLKMNDFEEYRLGMDVHTNNKLSKFGTIGGYFAYGTKDKVLKYGGDVGAWIAKDRFSKISFSYRNDIIEPGAQEFYFDESGNDLSDGFFSDMFKSRMDKFEEYRIGARYKWHFWKFYTSAQTQTFEPHYVYSFKTEPIKLNISEVSISVRFCYGEVISKVFGSELSLGSKYPTIYLNISQGINNIANGSLKYTKIQTDISQKFTIRNIGETSIAASTGIALGSAPYQKLFIGPGANISSYPFYSNNRFQTMPIDAFSSSRFVHFFFEHNFKTLLLKTKNFSPEISLVNNIGFGKLDNPSYHNALFIQDYTKGYYEGGLLLRNIAKFNYANLIYIGLGGAAFYNYGSYAKPNWKDNMVFKLAFTISFTK